MTFFFCHVIQPSVLRASIPYDSPCSATLPVYRAQGKPSLSMNTFPEYTPSRAADAPRESSGLPHLSDGPVRSGSPRSPPY